MNSHLKEKTNPSRALFILILLALSQSVNAGAMDDPILSMVLIDQLEVRDTDTENPTVLEGQAWIGKDIHKLWIKTDIERADGITEEAEVQALYSGAFLRYWNFQAGLRKDFQPSLDLPSRSFAVIGFQGLAPYFFEIDTALFLGEKGRAGLRLGAEYELLFTQKLILTPEIEVNLNSKRDLKNGVGQGLSDLELGLRLRYEISREFAPYFGLNWARKYGDTADYAQLAGEDVSESQAVIGVRAWF
jgi:copper resistance protein B